MDIDLQSANLDILAVALCLSWLVFFSRLAWHPDLTEEQVEGSYFARQRPRALAGVVLYLAAGTAGFLTHTLATLVIFLILPAFYRPTSHCFDQRPTLLRNFRSNKPPKGNHDPAEQTTGIPELFNPAAEATPAGQAGEKILYEYWKLSSFGAH